LLSWPLKPAPSLSTIMKDTAHAIDVTAESLYEAVAQALLVLAR
jgi:hypothetical protein